MLNMLHLINRTAARLQQRQLRSRK